MFPYRRPGQKKRNRGFQHHKQRDGREGGGRRLPGSPRELLPLLQPTTKALAHLLAGKSKSSGQLVHARNVLGHAQRMVDERLVDRMSPRDREEFLEQLARLKLTLADAESEQGDEAAPEELEAPPPPPVDRDRVKALAWSLTSPVPQRGESTVPVGATPALDRPPAESAEPEAEEEMGERPPAPTGSLRPTPGLGRTTVEVARAPAGRARRVARNGGAASATPSRSGERERLRLPHLSPEPASAPDPAAEDDGTGGG